MKLNCSYILLKKKKKGNYLKFMHNFTQKKKIINKNYAYQPIYH